VLGAALGGAQGFWGAKKASAGEGAGRVRQWDEWDAASVYAAPPSERCPAHVALQACSKEDEMANRCFDKLGPKRFFREFAHKKPVLILGAAQEWGEKLPGGGEFGGFPLDPSAFMERFGDAHAIVNTYGQKVSSADSMGDREMPLREAFAEISAPGSTKLVIDIASGSATDGLSAEATQRLSEDFRPPEWLWNIYAGEQGRQRFKECKADDKACKGTKSTLLSTVYSMGSSDARGGVPWHIHGEAYLTLLWGAKQWGLAPPGMMTVDVRGDWMVPPGRWHQDVWPGIENAEAKTMTAPCVQIAGETMYIPEMWSHTTRNVLPVFAMGEQVSSLDMTAKRTTLEEFARFRTGKDSFKSPDVEASTYLRNYLIRDPEKTTDARQLAERILEEYPSDMRAHHFYMFSFLGRQGGGKGASDAFKKAAAVLDAATIDHQIMYEGVRVQLMGAFYTCLRSSCKLMRPSINKWIDDMGQRYGTKSAAWAAGLAHKSSLLCDEAEEIKEKELRGLKLSKKARPSAELFAEAADLARQTLDVGDFQLIGPERLGRLRRLVNEHGAGAEGTAPEL